MAYHQDYLIVGAGISGLVLGQRLEQAQQNFLILEKSKGVGGRMATRRGEGILFDHGAQFYKVQKNETWNLDQQWSQLGLSHPWFERDQDIYKCASAGMTSLAKALVRREKIVFEERIISLKKGSDDYYEVLAESGKAWRAKKVFLSSPLPQSLEILKRSEIFFPSELEKISYASALVGLFEVESESWSAQATPLFYQEYPDSELYSISNQLSKKMGSKLAFTAVMQPTWSREHFEQDENKVLAEVEKTLLNKLTAIDPQIKITGRQLKKWRYSHPESTYAEKYLQVGEDKNIYLLGDAFGGASIRGACRSAESVNLGF